MFTDYYYQQTFNHTDIDKLISDNALIDARGGGMLLGPSHDSGGIYFLYESKGCFKLFGEVEGFEYVINRKSAIEYRQKIGEINNLERDFHPDFKYLLHNKLFKTINAISPDLEEYKSKFIILDNLGGFAIINKYSTAVHLDTIEKINNWR